MCKICFKRRILSTLVLLISCCAMVQAAVIRGKVVDALDKSPLPQTTVKLLAAADSAYVKGVASSDKGFFSFSDVKPGSYIVQIEYLGYNTERRNVKISGSEPTVRLGVIEMS